MTISDINQKIITDPREIKEPKYYNFLCMLYASMLLASVTVCMYVAKISFFVFTEGSAIIPFMYFFGGVITEVYGYERSRNLIWYALACDVLFVLIIVLMVHLPSPADWKMQKEFRDVLGPLYRVMLAGLIVFPLSEFANIYVISKFKIFIKGRYFWLRGLTATMVGEFTLALLGTLIIFTGSMTIKQMLVIVVASFTIKVAFSALAVMPASMLVKWLKKAEGMDIFDHHTNFNPFKFTNSRLIKNT